jgi:hypothetical protein
MIRRIFFIESSDEIDLLEDLFNEDSIVVSINPPVSKDLKKRGIPFFTTLKFFDSEGHHFVHNNSFKIVEDLRPFLKNIKSENIQHTFERTWIFYFRFHLNYYLSMLYIINQAVTKYNPDFLITASTDPSNKNLISAIVEGYGLVNNLKAKCITKKINLRINKPDFNSIKNLIKRFIFESQLTFIKYKFNNKAFIIAPEDTYNMPQLLYKVSQVIHNALPVYLKIQRKSLRIRISEMLRGKSFSFVFIPSDAKASINNNFEHQLLTSSLEIKNHLVTKSQIATFFGLNINIFLNDYIENKLNKKMRQLNCELVSLRKILEVLKPNKVFSQHSLGISYALGEVCLELDIPALLISHGSHSPHNEKIAKLEWSIHSHTIFNSHYPFVAIQTPLAKKFLNMQDDLISKEIETGQLLLTTENNVSSKKQIRNKLYNKKSDKRIVVHAGTPKGWNSLRPWIYETIDEYINNINDIINAIEEIPDIYLAIRFRPQSLLSLDDLSLLLKKSECYGIYTDGSFGDYLLSADLLISYSSTTIEEALQSQVPVLQYDPSGKYEHISGQILSNSSKNNVSELYSVLSEADLMPALKWWSKSLNNDTNFSWSKYIIEPDNKMEWLSQMESEKC